MMILHTRKGEQILVDDADYERLNEKVWRVDKRGYARTSIRVSDAINDFREETLHRYVLGMKPGDGNFVDHINGNKLDNRRENLRVCTNTQNGQNMKLLPRNTSGFKGVSWNKSRKKWLANIRANGKQFSLGGFENKEEAAHAYNRAAVALHGDFAVLNPIGKDKDIRNV